MGLTGLHFFHLLFGLFLCCLFFWGCSFPYKNLYFLSLRVSEIHLFYNLQLFYWHFLEFLWLFIFQVFYTLSFNYIIFLMITGIAQPIGSQDLIFLTAVRNSFFLLFYHRLPAFNL